MSIQKRAAGYTVRWRDTQGRQRSQQVQLWRDAVALDGEMKRMKAMGELVSHEKGRITLNDFWEIWWHNYALPNLPSQTRDAYGQLWSKHVLTALGPRTKVGTISREATAAAVSRWSSTLAPSSVWKVCAVLQSVLERAVEWGYLPVNPAKGIKKPKLVSRRGRAITEAQLGSLVSELTDLRSRSFVLLLAWTGVRPGELRRLRWSDVSAALLRVDATKTDSQRSVDLRPEARKALLEWYLACGRPALTDWIFPAVGRRSQWTANAYKKWQTKVFAAAAARAGLRGVRPYDLRHTAASRMIAEGRDVLYVARQLGHAPEITLKTYAHEFELGRKSVREVCADEADIVQILRADGGI